MGFRNLHHVCIFYLTLFILSLLSERIRGDVYPAGRPIDERYTLNIFLKALIPGTKLKNALKNKFLNISSWERTYFLHISIVLTIKPRKYLCYLCFEILFYFYFYFYFTYPYHAWLDWVWRLIYYHTYWFFASHPYYHSFSCNSASNWLVWIIQSLYFNTEKTSPGWFNGPAGWFDV